MANFTGQRRDQGKGTTQKLIQAISELLNRNWEKIPSYGSGLQEWPHLVKQ